MENKKSWTTALTAGLLIVFVYFLLRLGNTTHTQTITVSINGLTDTYTTRSTTVAELLDELSLNEPILSLTPPETELLTDQSVVLITTQPTARDAIVAANMQDTIKRVADAARKKAEEAQRQAEAALVPKSPTYYGMASWYSFGKGMNAASTQFPKGTRLRVIAINSGKTIIITINDYGPEDWTGVMLDLNKPAFAKLAPLGAGKIYIKYYKI